MYRIDLVTLYNVWHRQKPILALESSLLLKLALLYLLSEPDPPENCHLNVKKLPKNWHFKNDKKIVFFVFFFKMSSFLQFFWHSNGNFPEGQVARSNVIRNIRFYPKVGQITSKWDKSGTFSDQISVHFGSPSQNVLKSDLK